MHTRTMIGLATVVLLTGVATKVQGTPPPVIRWIDNFGECVSVCHATEFLCPCIDCGYKIV